MLDAVYKDYLLFLLVFLRFTGAFFFNPLLARKGIPGQIKAGLSLLCALAVTGTLSGDTNVQISSLPVLAAAGVKELLIGFVTGFMLNLLLSVAMIAGELIDLQLGVSMSKIYDPQSNTTVPLTGTLLNLILTLMFFLSNGHLTLIRILTLTFRILPPGPALLGGQFTNYLVLLFGQMLIMGVKIALPVVAAELIAEFGMGALMRTAPQINVFSVGLQLRILLGLAVILPAIPLFARAMDSGITYLFEQMEHVFRLMS